jgi:glycosyltransferase involved in cell wall biosynthesis
MILWLSLIIVLIIQCFFFVFFFARLLKNTKQQSLNSPESPPISVIVCAHNEASNLQGLIPSLLAQDYPYFELIIINDRSIDTTETILKDWASRDSRLVCHHIQNLPHWNPKKYALEFGINTAKFDWVLLTDADCMPQSKHWIRSMVAHIQPDKDIVLGFSPYQKKAGMLNAFIQYETFWTALQYFSFALAGLPYMGVGRNLMYRKRLFERWGGYESVKSVVGGDDDLFINAMANGKNTAVNLEPDSFMLSIPKSNWKEWYWQKIRHLSVGTRYRLKHQILLGLLQASQLGFWMLVLVYFFFAQYFEEHLWILTIIVLRIVVVWGLYASINQKYHSQVNNWLIPIFDFMVTIYIFTIGLIATTRKKIPWKN